MIGFHTKVRLRRAGEPLEKVLVKLTWVSYLPEMQVSV